MSPFTPKNWQDDPSTATPISALALEDLETRLAAYADGVAGPGDEQIRDVIGTALVAGSGITVTVNDAGDTITIASPAVYTDEQVRDTIGAALIAGVGGLVTVNDAGDTITIGPNPIEPSATLAAVTSTTTVQSPSSTGYTWIPYTVGMNVTFVFPTAARGRTFTLELRQDATGSRTYTWPGTVKWPAGVAPTPSGANKIDLVSFACDGTSWFGSYALNY